MARCHLVILKKPYLDAILEGRKRIESRFSRAKPRFFAQVLPGDMLFLKQSSGPVRAMAKVAAVENLEHLTPDRVLQTKRRYNSQIKAPDEYWRRKIDSRFGLLIWFKDARPIRPMRINKRDWRAWVVLTENEHFGLLSVSEVGVKE
jgi:ASC-1-like (ASCH) protein